MTLILVESQKLSFKNFWTFYDKEDRLAKLQKSDFQSHFLTVLAGSSTPAILNIFSQKIDLSFFDLLDLSIVIFLNLPNLSERVQFFFRCNFCDSTGISFIVISFHQIPLI